MMNSPHSIAKMGRNIKSGHSLGFINIFRIRCCMAACYFNLMLMETSNDIICSRKFWRNRHHFHFSMSFLDQTFCFFHIRCRPGQTYCFFTAPRPERTFAVNTIDHCSLINLIHYTDNCFKSIFFCCWKNPGNTDRCKCFYIS